MSNSLGDMERQVAEHIAAMVDDSLRFGAAGDWYNAVQSIRPIFAQYGPDEGFAWTRAMIRRLPIDRCGCEEGHPVQPVVAQLDTDTGAVTVRDIHDADIPTGIRVLAQMIAATANDDYDTARALWDAVVDNEDTEATFTIMERALFYAVQALREEAGRS